MKRLLLLLAVLGGAAVLAGPAAAAATTGWQGVVVAKDQQRHALVTASAGGVVRTVRVSPARVRAAAVGHRVGVRAARLADGTFQATSVRKLGVASKARVRAVLVRYQRAASRYLVSAGGSVFELRKARAARSLSSSHEPKPGEKIDTTVTVQSGGTLATTAVQVTGSVGVLELEGIVTELSAGSLKLVVARSGFVTVSVPADLALPASLRAFDAVELVVAVGSDGSFTLLAVQGGESEGKSGSGVRYDDEGDELEVKGTIVSLDATTIGVQPGSGASPATCSVPAGADLSGFAVGDKAEMECRTVAGNQFVLVELETKGAKFEAEERTLKAAGTITALDAASVTVTTAAGVVLTCALPAGVVLTGFAVGDPVAMKCAAFGASAPVLTRLQSDDEDDEANQTGDDSDDTEEDTDDDDTDDDDTDD